MKYFKPKRRMRANGKEKERVEETVQIKKAVMITSKKNREKIHRRNY